MKAVEVVVTSDFICPWCWIGHRNLKDGIAKAGLAADAVQVRFAPFELNPNMPREGQNRQTYRTRKFGSWARSQAMDAVRAYLQLNAGEREVVAKEQQAQLDGVRSVPMIRIAGQAISGAQPAAELALALSAAAVEDPVA